MRVLLSLISFLVMTPMYGINSFDIENYDINFDPDITIYNISINGETELNFIYDVDENTTVQIDGNHDLEIGDTVSVKISNKEFNREYKFNIKDKIQYTYINDANVEEESNNALKAYISIGAIVVCLIELIFIVKVLLMNQSINEN